MKKIILTSSLCLGICFIVSVKGKKASNDAPFSTRFTRMNFTHSSPTSGTLSCKVASSSAGFKTLKNANGTFTVSPQGENVYHVFSEVSGESKNFIIIWRGNFLVDKSTGKITSSSLVITKIDKKTGEVQISKTATGTGKYDKVDINSASGDVDGSF